MLGLKSKSRELSVSLLVAGFALAIFLLLQFEDFFEGRLGDGCRDFVFAVKVLYPSQKYRISMVVLGL